MKGSVLRAIVFGAVVFPTSILAADKDDLPPRTLPVPTPCTCGATRLIPYDDVFFTYIGGDHDDLDGWCRYRFVLLEDAYCPSQPRCVSVPKEKQSTVLAATVTNTRPACLKSIFKPYKNPFLSASALFAGPEQVLAYLSRYTHRVAISNRRLVAADRAGVTFRWKDYRVEGPGRYQTMTLSTHEFIRRFLMHVLPGGFHRITDDPLSS